MAIQALWTQRGGAVSVKVTGQAGRDLVVLIGRAWRKVPEAEVVPLDVARRNRSGLVTVHRSYDWGEYLARA